MVIDQAVKIGVGDRGGNLLRTVFRREMGCSVFFPSLLCCCCSSSAASVTCVRL